jgi:DNA invertase Pin-like site-specific DNA recombinase
MRRHRLEGVVCWWLDRLGPDLRHLVLCSARANIAFATLGDGIDTSSPAGRLVAGVLASIAEFEQARLRNASSRCAADDRYRDLGCRDMPPAS